MSALSLEVVRDPAQLDALADPWLALLGQSASNEPMLSPAWLLPWWRIYGNRHELALGLFRDGERVVGLAPLLRRRYWHWPGLPFRRLELLGADVDEEDGVGSDYLHLIAATGAEESVAAAFAAAVAHGAFGAWDELSLPNLGGGHPMTAHLIAAFHHHELSAECVQITVARYVPLPATWEDYLKALDKKDRYNLLRAGRDFDAWAAGDGEVRRASTPAELEEGRHILAALHNERWEAASVAGAFQGERFAAFHAEVMPRLLAAGALELLWLTVRGEAVAAMYNVVWNNKVYFYQCGRRLDVPHHLRLGIVLIGHALRAAIAVGRREFDFLGGDARYKRHLALAHRPIESLRVGRPSLLEGAHRLAESGFAGLRQLRNAGRSAVGWLRGRR
jgi:CelD/BcsL family acetyltransferase involved in cellulose biosynthesis